MKRYASYKASGVEWLGEVPSHWTIEKLKFFVGFAGGGTPSKDNPDYWNGAIPWVSPKDMKRPRISETEDYISEAGQANSPCTVIPLMSVLTVVRSGILQHSIPVAINEVPVTLNQDMKALLPSERVDSRFLAYQIAGCQVELREAWVKQGATVESIEHQRMADSRLALPSLDEQQAIADYLDAETARIDTLIQEKEGLIGLLREARTSVVSSLLLEGLRDEPKTPSNTEWLGEVPASWVVCRAKHAITRIEQGWSPECENRRCIPGEWGVLKAGACNHGQFNALEHKFLPPTLEPIPAYEVFAGDVLMSRASGSADLVGSVAYVKEIQPHLMLSDKLFRLVPEDHVHGRYLAWVLNTDIQRRQILERVRGAEGLARNITTADIKQLWIALPPMDEQRQLAMEADKVADAYDVLITHTQEAIALLKELRAATIADAVLGRVDVRQ